MIRTSDNRKLLDCFVQIPLGNKKIEQLENYLEGKISIEELEVYTNLVSVPDKAKKMFEQTMKEYISAKKMTECKKFFDLIFAVGGANSYKLLPWQALKQLNRTGVNRIEPDKLCCVYAQHLKEENYWLANGFRDLMDCADKDPQNLIRAASYCQDAFDSAKLILYANYFLMKYPNIEQKNDTSVITVLQEDLEHLKEYEDIVLFHLGKWHEIPLNEDQTEQLTECIRTGIICQEANSDQKSVLRSELKKIVGNNRINKQFLYSIIGCTYVNFALSKILRTVVCLCGLQHDVETLKAIDYIDIRGDIKRRGGDFDELFGIEPDRLISWAAERKEYNILRQQFQKDKEQYLEIYKRVDLPRSDVMLSVIRETDDVFYKTLVEMERKKKKEQVISLLIAQIKSGVKDFVTQYLNGETTIDKICSIRSFCFSVSYDAMQAIENFYELYHDEAFFRRCEAYLVLALGSVNSLFIGQIERGGIKAVKKIFYDLQQEQLPFAVQWNAATVLMDSYFYDKERREQFLDVAKDIFARYVKENKEELKKMLSNAEVSARTLALMSYGVDAQANKEEILNFTKDSSKAVKEKLIKLLGAHEDWSAEVVVLLDSSKMTQREIAVRVIGIWNKPAYQEYLKKALEKEKNEKLKAQIMAVLNKHDTTVDSSLLTKEELVKRAMDSGKYMVTWAYKTPFSVVHKKDGTLAEEEYLQAILAFYALKSPCGISKEAERLVKELDILEFAVYANELFDKWILLGAEAKKRWVLYVYAIHGGTEAIRKIYENIQEWAKNARGAIAAEAVQALALNPQPQALLIVDSIARRFKFKQVKGAASKALDFAAKEFGLTRAQLEDKIVPDLGFDETVARVFDYGMRKFTVTITPSLQFEVTDENNKKLSAIPKPGKWDDEENAAKAYVAYKELKSQMKTVVSSQKTRLERALFTARQWTKEEWQALFVKNPIMHSFAIGLIWGIYDLQRDQKWRLNQSFRYMEDGSFNTIYEEEYTIAENAKIGLVHPLELSQEEKAAWIEQLQDYEITQPFAQLERKIYVMTEAEKEEKSLERFGGYVMNALSLSGKMQKFGWSRGEVGDGGFFATYYMEDTELELGAELHFSGCFVEMEDENVTIYDVRFYKIDAVTVDESNDENAIFLKEIPERYFSEIVLQLEEIVHNSGERDEDWKRKQNWEEY